MTEVIKQLPPLDDVLKGILGRPCFQCSDIADSLRHNGVDIPFKAEEEQAHSIHYLLNEYLIDPEGWDRRAVDKLIAMRPVTVNRVRAFQLMRLGKHATLTRVVISNMVEDSGSNIWFAVMPLRGSLVDAHYFPEAHVALDAFTRDFAGDREFKSVSSPLKSRDMASMMKTIEEAETEATRIKNAILLAEKTDEAKE